MLNRKIKFLFLCFILSFIVFVDFAFAKILSTKEMLDMLNTLKVGSDCNVHRYSRNTWKHWITEEKGGYDTRQRLLIKKSLIAPMLKEGSKKVARGRWYGAYTDKIFKDPRELDIDHLVPLGEAHKSGGCYWSKEKKKNMLIT